MRFTRSLMAVLMALACANTAFAQKGQYVEPKNGAFDKYPILPSTRSLTDDEIVHMKLRLIELDHPVDVSNHFRNVQDAKGRHVLETLVKGTKVYVDEFNNIRYKRDCANRIVEGTFVAVNRTASPETVIQTQPTSTSATQPETVIQSQPEKGFWNHVADFGRAAWHALGDLLSWVWGWILWALKGLFALVVITMIVGALIEFWEWLRRKPTNPEPVVTQTDNNEDVMERGVSPATHALGIADARRRSSSTPSVRGQEAARPSDPARQVVLDRQGAEFRATVPPPPTTQSSADGVATPKSSGDKSDDVYLKYSAGSGSKPHDLLEWTGMHTVTFKSEGGKCTVQFIPKK